MARKSTATQPKTPAPDGRLEMLPFELRLAVEAARFRCKDPTIMARIEDYQHTPGRIVIERGGKDLQHGLHLDQGVEYLGALR